MAKHTTCTKITSLLHPDKVYSSIEEWENDHTWEILDEAKIPSRGLDHEIRKVKYITGSRSELASDGRSMLHYKDFKSKKDSQRYLQEYWDEQNDGTEDEDAVIDNIFNYDIIEK